MGVGEDDRVREQRDIAWDALREIEVIVRSESEDWSKLDGIGAIISNGPLDTAPGGPREDECERLRGEVERLRTERAEIIAALRSAKYGVEGVHEIDAYDDAPTVVDCVRYLAEQRAREADAADRSEGAVAEALRCLTLIGHRDGTLRDWPAKARAAADVLAGVAASLDAPVDALARVGQDVQPDGYATHTTCAACGGTKFESIMDPEAGACRSCSGSGRVPVVSLEQEDNR